MRILTWGKFSETKPAWKNARLRTWRWALKLRAGWVAVECESLTETGSWSVVGGYYLTWWMPWLWFRTHTYYDGPNCALVLGPFQFQRSALGWCLVCAPDSHGCGAANSWVNPFFRELKS